MGSSNSKVTPVRVNDEDRASVGSVRITGSLTSRIQELEAQIRIKDETISEAEEKLAAAEHQVKTLSAEVQECLSTKEKPCRSCLALECMVSKLEEELSQAKTEIEQMELSHERHIQRVRSLSAKSQAKSALSLFELRDENQRLVQENAKLLEQMRQTKQSSTDGSPSCDHMTLIINLSQQLNAQEAELNTAQDELKRLRADQC